MIRQPFHQLQPFAPSISTVDLTHGSSLFLRIQVSERSPHFSQSVMKKSPVICALPSDMIKIHLIIARTYLLQNHIDAGHMLPPQRLKIMPCPQAKPCMGSVILNHMADILHAMLPAPFSDLTAEIPAVQIGHHVHILISGLWAEIPHLVP